MAKTKSADEIDRQIIHHLARDGRITARQLSKVLPISEGTARLRLRRLLNSAITTSALVNPAKVGFPIQAALGIKVKLSMMSSVAAQLSAHERIAFVAIVTGTYDIIALALCQGPGEIHLVMQDVIRRTLGIKDIQPVICLETYRGHYLSAAKLPVVEGNRTPSLVDSVDVKMIRLLADNGRITSRQMAKALYISEATARRRLTRLIDQRIITVRAQTAPDRMGLPIVATIGLRVDLLLVNDILAKLATNPRTYHIATCAGAWDIMVTGLYKSTRDLHMTLQNYIANVEGVREAVTHVYLEGENGHFSRFVPHHRAFVA